MLQLGLHHLEFDKVFGKLVILLLRVFAAYLEGGAHSSLVGPVGAFFAFV